MKTKSDWKLPHRFLFCFVLFFSFLTFQQQKYFISQTPFTLPPFKNFAVSSSLYKKYAKSYCGYTFDCKNVDTHKSVSRGVSSFMDLVERELLAREDWDEIYWDHKYEKEKDALFGSNIVACRDNVAHNDSWGSLEPSSRKYERPTTWFRPKCK